MQKTYDVALSIYTTCASRVPKQAPAEVVIADIWQNKLPDGFSFLEGFFQSEFAVGDVLTIADDITIASNALDCVKRAGNTGAEV